VKTLDQIRFQLARGEFEFSRHAFRRAAERNISEIEIRQAGSTAVIVEAYPADKYSPSCLLLGFTAGNRPLHIQVSQADTETTRIITIYEPDPDEWASEFTRRR
jgi:hypothetical protein